MAGGSDPGQGEQLSQIGAELLRRADESEPVDIDGQLVGIDDLLARIDEPTSLGLRQLTAELLEAKCVLLSRADRPEAQAKVIAELIARFDGASERKLAVSVGWAVLQRISLELGAGCFDEAVVSADELLGMFRHQPESQDLTRYGSLLLSASDRLMRAGCPEPALRLGQVVADRLWAARDSRRRVVAAGGQLGASFALAQIGRYEDGMEGLEKFVTAGEIGLAAVDQAEARLSREEGSPSLSARLSLARIAVLEDLDRCGDARAIASGVFSQLKDDDSPFVQQVLAELREILS